MRQLPRSTCRITVQPHLPAGRGREPNQLDRVGSRRAQPIAQPLGSNRKVPRHIPPGEVGVGARTSLGQQLPQSHRVANPAESQVIVGIGVGATPQRPDWTRSAPTPACC